MLKFWRFNVIIIVVDKDGDGGYGVEDRDKDSGDEGSCEVFLEGVEEEMAFREVEQSVDEGY